MAPRRVNNNMPKKRKQRRTRRPRNMGMKMSPEGEAFLKCAFAPPDFNTDPGKGIPDDYQGKVLSRKDASTTATTFAAGKDTYLLIAPTPGIAYWSAVVNTGATIVDAEFVPVAYPSYNSIFGGAGGDRAANVTSFRYVSNCVGIYPTSNINTTAGAIQVWKFRMDLLNEVVGLGTPVVLTPTWVINGTESIKSVGPENYSDSFIKGVYTQSACNEPDFEFSPIIEHIGAIPSGTVTLSDAGMFNKFGTSGAAPNLVGITGLGKMDVILIKISVPATATATAIVKNWSCLEYRPNTSSAFYSFAHDSPAADRVAMAAYRKIAKSIPVAVPCSQNATFWERCVQILRGGLSLASSVPGPVGMTAMGFSGLIDMITGLSV